MKKVFFTLCLVCQFINTSVSADITKFLGDPYPVDYVFDCIEAKDKLKINTQFGFTKIKPIEDIYIGRRILLNLQVRDFIHFRHWS